MVKNVIQIKIGITINVDVSANFGENSMYVKNIILGIPVLVKFLNLGKYL